MYRVGYKPCYDNCSQIVLTTGCLINNKKKLDGRTSTSRLFQRQLQRWWSVSFCYRLKRVKRLFKHLNVLPQTLRLAVLIQHRSVADRQTDKHTTMA